MLTAERMKERAAGIGGSDIAAALGLSPWKTPLDLFMEKTGQREPDDISGNAAVEWGNRLEDVVAEKFSDDTGLRVRRKNGLIVDGERPFMLANIDRAIPGKPLGLRCGLECKTANPFAAKHESWGDGAVFEGRGDDLQIVADNDQVPDHYLLQCVWYMAITGSDLWFLSVLIGGSDFRTYTIRRDPDLERSVIRRAERFWTQHVIARVPPAPTSLADLETIYAQDNGAAVDATPEVIETWFRVKELQQQQKTIELELDGAKVGGTSIGGLKNKLRMAIGEHAELLLGSEGKPLATWKTTKPRKVFDLDAFKKDHPKLHREYLVEKPGTRPLLIK